MLELLSRWEGGQFGAALKGRGVGACGLPGGVWGGESAREERDTHLSRIKFQSLMSCKGELRG